MVTGTSAFQGSAVTFADRLGSSGSVTQAVESVCCLLVKPGKRGDLPTDSGAGAGERIVHQMGGPQADAAVAILETRNRTA